MLFAGISVAFWTQFLGFLEGCIRALTWSIREARSFTDLPLPLGRAAEPQDDHSLSNHEKCNAAIHHDFHAEVAMTKRPGHR